MKGRKYVGTICDDLEDNMTLEQLIIVLWPLICQVESENDWTAYNKKEDAVGIAQIRPIMVKEVNRILKLQGKTEFFTLNNRFDKDLSREMFEIYTRYWGKHYEKNFGVPTLEVLARMWPGGPDGWTEDETLSYWKKIQDVQSEDEAMLYRIPKPMIEPEKENSMESYKTDYQYMTFAWIISMLANIIFAIKIFWLK